MAEVAVEPKQLDFTHLDAAVDQLDTPEDRDG